MGINYISVLTLCMLFLLGVCANFTELETNSSRANSSRLLIDTLPLSPFSLIKILNDKCDAGNGQFGTCLAKKECFWKGGIGYSICGQGFGICCVITAKENGVAFGNNTRLYRSTFNAGVELTYTIFRMSDDICQFRLDVTSLTLYKAETDGICFNDYMTVNQDTKFNKVCGTSQNIHYYIEVSDKYAIFTFHTNGNVDLDRDWEIYVSQYTCDMGAPTGCGQWYRGQSGKIQIWNNIKPSDDVWYYLEDQEYAICVRWEAGYCSITYTESEAFRPKCYDLFQRPSDPRSSLRTACELIPPNNPITYTFNSGEQIFYVRFKDSTNSHINSIFNTFKNPDILYSQNTC